MGFDLFQSRRNYNEKCRWWVRNEDEKYEENTLVYKRVPDGQFWTKEITAEADNNNVVGGDFFTDKTSVTLETPDNLYSVQEHVKNHIKSEVLVDYQGELWRVTDVQMRKARIQNSEFGKPTKVSHKWYLTLIK